MTDELEASRERVEDSYLLLIGAYERTIRTYLVLGRIDRAESEGRALKRVRTSLDEWRCRSAALHHVRLR